ncbi:MAG: dTDP-glucose pyrophosphorylase [Planctomycetota bacterium]|jgi:dTDP-glucose pyrophosphorylase
MSTTSSSLQGVILAAGKGTRIQPLSEHLPKPLLPILDKPLLVWQIEEMRNLGIRDIVIVIGHLGHHVVKALGNGSALGVNLTYVEQQDMLGIAHAVAQLTPYVDRPFLLFLGDIFFETEDLSSMLDLFARDDVQGVLAVKKESDVAAIRKNFTVTLNDQGFVERVIEKPWNPTTDLKGCGLYLFDDSIFDAIRRTPRTALRDEYELTEAVQIFVDQGAGVVPAPVVQADLNLSNGTDLLDINLHVMRKAGHDNWIAETAKVGDGAELNSVVVMSGATVAAGAVLEECLVMPNETAPPGKHRRKIFMRGHEISCV